jgi:hypothetical protein
MKTNLSLSQWSVRSSVKRLACLLGFGLLGLTATQCVHATGAANDHTVLILDPTVTGGITSVEALAAITAGYDVEDVDDAGWSAKSQADFATYVALILGDPTCVVGDGPISSAEANVTTWSPIVSGNVVVIGTDPVFHHFAHAGATTLINNGIAFATAQGPGKTGLYCCLSCYYTASGLTSVPVLSGIAGGGFMTEGNLDCAGAAHIVATAPTTSGLSDADLSNWECSVHEAFTAWPSTFSVLAIALNQGSYVAADGSVGNPYILASGSSLVEISSLTLTPGSAKNPLGASHTLTATLTEKSTVGGVPSPVEGVVVTFTVTAGPDTGVTGTGTTDVNGVATFTYTSSLAGTDTIVATATDSDGPQTSNIATKQWVAPPTLTATPVSNRGMYDFTGTSAGYAVNIYVSDSASAFVAGPYPSGTTILIKKAATTGTGPGVGLASVTVFVTGNGVVYAEDTASQLSASQTLRPD